MVITEKSASQDIEGDMGEPPVSPLLHLMRRCNSFFVQGLTSSEGLCQPLLVSGRQVGVLKPSTARLLLAYTQVFTATPSAVVMNPQLSSFESRSAAMEAVLRDLRTQNIVKALRGWRDECFYVWAEYGAKPLFQIERSAAAFLGIRAFGVHLTGYTQLADGSLAVWLQKRADDKPTWPGMLDTMVGGGVTAGLTPTQVLYKEAAEEASIPAQLVDLARPAGTVSFFTETERGLHANTEYVYELQLPQDFTPTNSDGEVQGFELVPVNEALMRVLSPKYKLTSAPILIDFLLRKGLISHQVEPCLPELQELLSIPLSQLYRTWPLAATMMSNTAGTAAESETEFQKSTFQNEVIPTASTNTSLDL